MQNSITKLYIFSSIQNLYTNNKDRCWKKYLGASLCRALQVLILEISFTFNPRIFLKPLANTFKVNCCGWSRDVESGVVWVACLKVESESVFFRYDGLGSRRRKYSSDSTTLVWSRSAFRHPSDTPAICVDNVNYPMTWKNRIIFMHTAIIKVIRAFVDTWASLYKIENEFWTIEHFSQGASRRISRN